MRSPTSLAAGLVVLALTFAPALRPASGRAQEGAIPAVLAGNWTSESSATRAMQIVDAAFEPGVTAMPYFFQSLARSRIHESMRPASRIAITLSGTHLRVVFTSEIATKVIEGDLGAMASVSGLEEGTTVQTTLRTGWLMLSYDGEGDMTQLLSTEPDGARLHLDSNVTSDRLPVPARWRLDYLRSGT